MPLYTCLSNRVLTLIENVRCASSINFMRSPVYGLDILGAAVRYRLKKLGLAKFDIFAQPAA